MKILFSNNCVTLKGAEDFSLKHTFDCGQCFRFTGQTDGSFSGVAFKKPVVFRENGGDITIEGINEKEFYEVWKKFLDLDRDYSLIKSSLIHDEIMKKAVEYGGGIRILRQDFFECLISFIISQQNNIPRIRRSVEGLCRLFGTSLESGGQRFYAFPSPEELEGIGEKELEPLRLGYRTPYIVGAVKEVLSGELCGKELEAMSYCDAKKRLLEVRGIGNKVADCILLFSLGKFEAFPVDTWIKKAMLKLFNVDEKEIADYKTVNYGKYSGFAQQYIFYYMRSINS